MLTKLMRRAARLSCSWQIDWPVNVCWWCNVWLYFLFIVFVYFRLLNFSFFHLCCATTYDAEIKLYIMHLCVMYFAWSLSIVSSVDLVFNVQYANDVWLLRPPPVGSRLLWWACLSVDGSVCLSTSTSPELRVCPVNIVPGCDSVLLWRRCDVMYFRFCGCGIMFA